MQLTEQIELHKKGQNDPEWWVRNALGDDPWPKQVEILESVRDNPETSVKSCHGAGKSWVAGRVGLSFLFNHYPSIVITTAPTDRQVRGILWKEIRTAHAKAIRPLGGRVLTQELHLSEDWFAWGFTAPDYDPTRFQGFHEVYILVIVDEASGVSGQIHEGIDGILTSEHARKLEIGNPTDPTSHFAGSFKAAGVNKITITAFDTPNFTAFGITQDDIASNAWEQKITGPLPAPHLVTPHWVAKRFARWGPTSPLYQSRVEAQFPEEGTDTLIPLAWVEAAQQRTLEPSSPHELGVDVARYGDDIGAIARRQGPVCRIVERISKASTMVTAGKVSKTLHETKADLAKIDTIGIGAGVFDRLEELEEPVAEANASAKAEDPERFVNARAEWFWGLRERFESGDIDLDPADEETPGQLSGIKYRVDSRGRILIESKDEMKRRGQKSPNEADAIAIAFGNCGPASSPALVDPDLGYNPEGFEPSGDY